MGAKFIPFALPDLDHTELDEIKQVLDTGWVTTGAKAQQFEYEFAAITGAKHAIAVNSCTAAMHLALEAIGLQRGDEVITTPYTFAATAEVIRYFDARPVLVDIRADDFNLDAARLAEAVTPRTRAVIPVHIAGLPADLDAIAAVAATHNLAIVEDAAHAFPTKYQGRIIGSSIPSAPSSLRHTACFSFYATKTITTGEGGMIVTDDDQLADRCRIMALHGISRDAWKRYTAEGSWYYEIIAPGYKYNMTDIAAAMGLAQLHKVERMAERRAQIARRYHAAFADIPALQVPTDRIADRHAWHLYMLRLNLAHWHVDRARVIEELRAHEIGVSVHFIPLHIHPYYRASYGYHPEDLPIAYGEYLREISLPIYSKMTDHEVDRVITAVLEVAALYAG